MSPEDNQPLGSDDDRDLDLDYQDFVNSFDIEPEPLSATQQARRPLQGRRRSRRGDESKTTAELLEEYKSIHYEFHQLTTQICDDQSLNAERKARLIHYAAKRSGVTVDSSNVVQILLEHHLQQKYGTNLLVISDGAEENWFDTEEDHLIETLLSCNDLNIIGGLSGASKTTVTAMMLAALLQKRSHFLGFKVNHHVCGKVFFIGLDGGKNVYRPIFEKTGLLKEGRPIENFNFIPNESGWSMSSTNLDKLDDLLKGTESAIVVVDSLLAATTGTGVDENSAQMSARILDLKLVCERHGATPIILAHQKKEATQDFIGSDSLRGHSSIPCFAGNILTLNFLDQKAKVNGKNVPDRKNPKRRLVAGYRGTPVDLLVEIDFDKAEIKSYGEFYEALFAANNSADLDDVVADGDLLSYVSEWTTNKKTILDALRGYEEPVSQAQLEQETGINKGTVSRTIKALLNDRFGGNPFVQSFDAGSGKTLYHLNHLIRTQLESDY